MAKVEKFQQPGERRENTGRVKPKKEKGLRHA